MRKIPFYPLLVGVVLVLGLYSRNRLQLTGLGSTIVPILGVIDLGLILLVVGRLLLRSWSRSALVVTPLLLLYLVLGSITKDLLVGLVLVHFGLVVVVGFAVVVKRLKSSNLGSITLVGNILLTCIVVVVLIYALVPGLSSSTRQPLGKVDSASTSTELRDIYYIVMDEYTRDDVLLDMCNFDNSEFTDWLRDEGFYVADNSYANYPHTVTYLASTLNMNYLPEPVSLAEVVNLIDNNEVYEQLRQRGYTIIHINSWCSNNLFSASTDTIYSYEGWSEFFKLFLSLTPYNPESTMEEQYYNTTLYQFDKLQEIPQMPEATFTFVHIMMTHAPPLFNPDGSFRENVPPTGRMYTELYTDQIQAANRLLQDAICTILAEGNAVIILQGDTGTQPPDLLPYLSEHDGNFSEVMQDDPYIVWARLADLNAIYSDCDYEFTSPINTFRIIFNHYFDANYAILPDRHFFEIEVASKPFEFFEVTDELREYGGER